MAKRYMVQISYKGTKFRGWQKQPNLLTVQGQIESAFRQAFNTPIVVHGCGRTDAGVHAYNYFAHLDAPDPPPLISRDDILIHQCATVPSQFNAQHHARSRTYAYIIQLEDDPKCSDLTSRFYSSNLDYELLQKCSESMVGEHDFLSFCKRPRDYGSTICTVKQAHWKNYDNGRTLRFSITANRFLRGMIRFLVSCMIRCAEGKIRMDEWFDLLNASRDRGSIAPAYPTGLYFMGATYDGLMIPRVHCPEFFKPVEKYLHCRL